MITFFLTPCKLFFPFLNSSFLVAMRVLESSECAKSFQLQLSDSAELLNTAVSWLGFLFCCSGMGLFLKKKQQQGQHGILLSPFSSSLCKFCSSCQASWCENVEVEAVTGRKKTGLSSCSWLIVLELVLKIEQSASLFCFL